MEFLSRILDPTPEYWKKVQKRLAIVLAIIAGLHGANATGTLSLPEWITQFFVVLEIIIPTIIGTAQTTSKKK